MFLGVIGRFFKIFLSVLIPFLIISGFIYFGFVYLPSFYNIDLPLPIVIEEEISLEEYMTFPKEASFSYTLRGENHILTTILYKGLRDYLKSIPRTITYYSGQTPPTTKDFIFKKLDNPYQKEALSGLINHFVDMNINSDDKVRIVTNLVQQIPYDKEGLASDILNNRYPYEVLFDNTGVCGEKSELLSFFFRELGYGVVYFYFDKQNHAAVGIKCSEEYDYLDSGYCFVESTTPSIITDSNGIYANIGKLTTQPEIIFISDGISFDATEDFKDSSEWNKLVSKKKLSSVEYAKWNSLIKKYGMVPVGN